MPSNRKTEAVVSRTKKRLPTGGLLAVDIGNSETVVGLFRGKEPVHFWRLTSGRLTADEASLQIEALLRRDGAGPGKGMGAVVCSVAPSLTMQWLKALEVITGRAALEVNSDTVKNLPIRYHDRSAVGAVEITA